MGYTGEKGGKGDRGQKGEQGYISDAQLKARIKGKVLLGVLFIGFNYLLLFIEILRAGIDAAGPAMDAH